MRQTFLEIAGLSDILVGNEEDFQLCLGLEGPAAGGSDLPTQIDELQGHDGRGKETVSRRTTLFATTLRQVVTTNHHFWGAIVSESDAWHVIEPRDITVLDRIGGGDGFVGGLLYGLLQGWDAERAAQFGWACGALATTLLTDYCQPADEAQVWSIWDGNARVQR